MSYRFRTGWRGRLVLQVYDPCHEVNDDDDVGGYRDADLKNLPVDLAEEQGQYRFREARVIGRLILQVNDGGWRDATTEDVSSSFAASLVT